MWFIVLGVVLIGLKLGDFGPVAAWSWWGVLSPFALALAWWAYSDATGMTRRHEMNKLEDRKVERRRKAMEALGIGRDQQRREEVAMRARRQTAERVEGARTATREHNEKVVRDSVFDSQHSTGHGKLSEPEVKAPKR
ncbi:MAG: TIGR04438 family Trp-rich protein [Aquincola sp.]|nr:TIGR04438 family Trp-rich protein [Aquincola sp.]MDH4289908.1 TIGR04438 family Trp-rich protein [Aquincola sp.]